MNTTEYNRYMADLKDRVRVLTNMGMPVRAFCRETGVSVSSFYRWQRDATKLRLSTLNKIDSYLSSMNL